MAGIDVFAVDGEGTIEIVAQDPRDAVPDE